MSAGLVVFGEDWGAHPSSTQHIVQRLAQDQDVVWVNSIGMRRPRFDRRDFTRLLRKLRKAFDRSRSSGAARATPSRMSIVDPLAVSWPGSAMAGFVNRQTVGRQVRQALTGRGMGKPVLWTSLPSAEPLLGEAGERAVVYYCGDDFSALAGVDHAAAAIMERRLVERADLIFAASEELASRFPASRTVLTPHGVDFELFSRPAPRADDLPQGPVAGFYGSLADWIDVEMLAQTARRLRGWRFVFIGPVQTDVRALQALENVRLLGPRPHHLLPSYAQHWDVSLLPFRDTAQIRACNPLKLREYLAAGAPVATTSFPALSPYLDHVHLARKSDDFAQAILDAAQDGAWLEARRARVADESWDARAAFVAHHLETL